MFTSENKGQTNDIILFYEQYTGRYLHLDSDVLYLSLVHISDEKLEEISEIIYYMFMDTSRSQSSRRV